MKRKNEVVIGVFNIASLILKFDMMYKQVSIFRICPAEYIRLITRATSHKSNLGTLLTSVARWPF